MSFLTPPTLALTISNLVFYFFFLAFVIGPWVAKVLKQITNQTNRSPQPNGPGRSGQTKNLPQSPDQGTGPPAPRQGRPHEHRETIVPRSARRAQNEPTNLTAAQRSQRAQAKAAYEQRAKQLQQSSASPGPKTRHVPTAAVSRTRPGNNAPATGRPPVPPQGLRQPATQPPKPLTQRITRSTARSSRSLRLRDTELHDTEQSHRIVHRRVPDASAPPRTTGPGRTLRLDIRSLRDAIVLKEILDKPVALRGYWPG